MAGSEIKMKMSLDSSGVKSGINKATESVKGFATTSMERLKKVGNFFKTGLVVGGGFLVGIKKSIDGMVEMKRSADRLGVSTESFQKLSFAAKQTGVDTDRLADAMKDLDVKLQDGIMRGGSFAELIQELGMDMNELAEMPSDQRMLAFADAIKDASGSLSRFGADEFGDAMFELLPLLEQGSDGILKMGENAVIASNAHIAAAERAQKLIDGATQTITGYFAIVTGELLQTFEWIVTGATQAVIEAGKVFGNLGDIIMAALRLDWDGVKAGFDNLSRESEGAFDRIGQAMDDVIDEHIAANNQVEEQRDAMTKAELSRIKKESDARAKAAKEREKALEKIADLQQKAADEREKREMDALTAQERVFAIQQKIADLEKERDAIDPFAGEEARIAKEKKEVEIEKLKTEEIKAQADAIDEQIAARDAAIDAQMKGLELERAIAEAMGDNQRVNALDRQIERQSMINELVQVYEKDAEDAKDIVDAIIAKKDEQKRKELEVIRAHADGNDMMAIQLQNQIDKHEEINRLVDEFGIGTKEATALVEKLAKIRFGPDINQSGFVTPREQREFERQEKERERKQRELQQAELKEERILGGGLLGKQIPEDITREERRRRDAEDRARRADLREVQRRERRGEDREQLLREINQRREARQRVEAIEDRRQRDAEKRLLKREEDEIKRRQRRGEDMDKIMEDIAKRRAERGEKLRPPAPGVPKEDPVKPQKPKSPEDKIYNKFEPILTEMKKHLDNIDRSLQC